MSRVRRKPKDAQRRYGVLVGSIADGRFKPEGASPHYEIWIRGDGDFRVAVNVRSVEGSEVLVHYEPTFSATTKLGLPAVAAGPQGFRPLSTGPGGDGLDYLRDGLFDVAAMQPIPDQGAGVSLQNLLDAQIERAKADADAVAIVLGEFFQDGGADQTFGFSPERGVHDIHMMQGNDGAFADDNRVNGDGALFIRFTDGETVALFTRFASQAIRTDDSTGAPA